MTLNAELANWGEPPVRGDEEALLPFLDKFLAQRARGEEARPEVLLAGSPELVREVSALIQAVECIEQFVASVMEHSDLQADPSSATGVETEAYEESLPGAVELPNPFPGKYRFQKLVGGGRFSRVWLAEHLRLQIPVALKTLHFQVAGEIRALALAALENEARVLARLQHPNIVRVYGLEQVGDEHYLVLQYVDGGSLQARLEKDGPLGWQSAARYIADVGEALAQLHALGIVHRDVKPANILWDRQRDEALLTDLGLAARLVDSHEVAGTPLYMAPEAFAGRSTPAGDVYGLAASLFTLVTGRVPFLATTRDELLERVRRGLPDPEPLFAEVPERLERIIRSGLAARPELRPELRAFVADLRGSLNRLMADSLILPSALVDRAAPVELRLTVSRWEGGDTYVPVATTHPAPPRMTRNLTKVPPVPSRAGLRTGDRVRIEVAFDHDGFVTVFNVGPTGHLSMLYPDPAAAVFAPPLLPANRPIQVSDVELTPPAGVERLFAVWSRVSLPLPPEELFRPTRDDAEPVSRSYRATRNMERVQASVQQLRSEDRRVAVLELVHAPR